MMREIGGRGTLWRPRVSATPLRHAAIVLAACALLAFAIVFLRRPDALEQLLRISPSALLLGAVLLAVALVCTGQWYVHRLFNEQDFVQHNEVGGFIIAVAGSLYAVVLGFLTVVAWQHYSDARQLVALESAASVDAWHVALGLPRDKRSRIRDDMLRYAHLMVDNEWPEMRAGKFDEPSGILAMDALDAAEDFVPANMQESNAQAATLQQLGVLHDVRQRRLSDNASGISTFEWTVLLLGAVCVLCFCWLFGLANRRVHLVMTSAVTVIIASTLILLFELQYPFRSNIGVPSDDWVAVIDHIHQMQTGAQMEMRM